MAAYVARKIMFTSCKPTSFPLLPSKIPVATRSQTRFLMSCKNSDSNNHSHTSDNSSLVGWWAGVSEEAKCPYGQIFHVSAEHERYLARSYSPWQLATAKIGTPVFEIYATTGLDGEYKEQAIHIKHKEACPHSLGSLQGKQIEMGMFPLTEPGRKTNHKKWVEAQMKLVEASEKYIDKEAFENFVASNGSNQGVAHDEEPEAAVNLLGQKTVIYFDFVVGDILEKNTVTLNKELLRVPSKLERKGCFSFCLMLEEDKDQHVSGDYSQEVYRTTNHGFLHIVDCIGKGIPITEALPMGENFISLLISRAQNQQPLLSRYTTFHRIDVPALPDPLNGLYIGSNGDLAAEVIQFRSVFGPWQGVGGMNDVSELESGEYVEAVNLTGDFDMPAGQVAFRAKVGDKYKLQPGFVLEKKYGAVARYKGKGRLPGFQNSEWVDVEVVILGEEYRCREGLAIAVLYLAPEYYFMKFFKQLNLQSFRESH